MSQKDKLKEVALVFFKLGCFAFGGPAAHVAMMEEEVVNKRKWMDRQYFLDLMGATNNPNLPARSCPQCMVISVEFGPGIRFVAPIKSKKY